MNKNVAHGSKIQLITASYFTNEQTKENKQITKIKSQINVNQTTKTVVETTV